MTTKTELTEAEMKELGFNKLGEVFVKVEDGVLCWTLARPNGNAPVGGQYYETVKLFVKSGNRGQIWSERHE